MAIAPVSIGGANRARSVLARPGRVGDFSAVAQGLGQLAERAQKDRADRDMIAATKADGEFRRQAAEAIADTDPMADDYEQVLRTRLNEIREGVLENTEIGTDRVREALRLDTQSALETGFNSALADRRNALQENAELTREQALEQTLADIRQDPGNAASYMQEFQKTAQGVGEAIPPQRRRQLAAAESDNLLIAQVEGLALAGDIDGARALADEMQGELPPETFRFTKRRIQEIENGQRQDFLSSTATRIADLRINIERAGNLTELDAMRRTIENEAKLGLFQGRQGNRSALLTRIETRRRQLTNENRDASNALAKYQTGTGLDTQKEADLVWPRVMENLGEDASPDQVLGHAAEFIKESGHVPTNLKRLVENAERTDDPETLAAAARVYDTVKGTGLENVETGASKQGSRVRVTSAMAELAGIPYAEAARRVSTGIPDAKVLKERREQFELDYEDFDPREFLRNEGVAPTSSFFGAFGEDAEIPTRAANDFENMLKLHYELIGNKEIAEKAAKERFAELYGTSRVGGTPQLVRHPPERFFPGAANSFLTPEQKTTILEEDVRRGLEGAGLKPATVIGEGGEAPAPGTRLGTTEAGRPIVVNSEGGLSTEQSATLEDPRNPGSFINIPTFFSGEKKTEEEALRIIQENGFVDPETGREIETYGSSDEAVEAAKARSASLDQDQNVREAFRKLENMSAGEDVSGIPAFELVADSQTEKDLAQGRSPSYQVRIRSDRGVMIWPRVLTEGGAETRLRYTMPDGDTLKAIPEYEALVKEERDDFLNLRSREEFLRREREGKGMQDFMRRLREPEPTPEELR